MITIEFIKQIRRPRMWITLGTLAIVTVVVTIIIGCTSASTPERLGNYGSVVPNSSGFTMAVIGLNALLLFLVPLAVAVFAGDSMAGEASWGSLRYLLARPLPRSRVLLSKVVVAGTCSIASVIVVSVAGLLSGLIAFGWHPLEVLNLQEATPFTSGLSIFTPGTALARIMIATGIVAISMVSIFAFSILCSTVTDRPFSAIAGGVFFAFVSRALDNIPGLHALEPWLPVTDRGSGVWTGVFFKSIGPSGLPHLLVVQACYAAAFLIAAWVWFGRRDVLT